MKSQFKKHDKVLVKVRDGCGNMTMQKGRVHNPSGKGAFVTLVGGNKNFFFNNDLSLDVEDELPRNKPNSIPPILAPPHFEPKPQPLPMIWHLFRAERVSRDIPQGVAAAELDIKLAQLTDIESGVELPDDELVLKFSETFGVDLKVLSEALQRSQTAKPVTNVVGERVPQDALVIETGTVNLTEPIEPELVRVTNGNQTLTVYKQEPSPGPSEPPIKTELVTTADINRHLSQVKEQLHEVGSYVIQPPIAGAVATCTYEEFIERLDALVSMPGSKEQRTQWFAHARGLFKLQVEGGV